MARRQRGALAMPLSPLQDVLLCACTCTCHLPALLWPRQVRRGRRCAECLGVQHERKARHGGSSSQHLGPKKPSSGAWEHEAQQAGRDGKLCSCIDLVRPCRVPQGSWNPVEGARPINVICLTIRGGLDAGRLESSASASLTDRQCIVLSSGRLACFAGPWVCLKEAPQPASSRCLPLATLHLHHSLHCPPRRLHQPFHSASTHHLPRPYTRRLCSRPLHSIST